MCIDEVSDDDIHCGLLLKVLGAVRLLIHFLHIFGNGVLRVTSLTADSRQTALRCERKGNTHQMAPATTEETHRRDNWAIFWCTDLLFAQRVLLLV